MIWIIINKETGNVICMYDSGFDALEDFRNRKMPSNYAVEKWTKEKEGSSKFQYRGRIVCK